MAFVYPTSAIQVEARFDYWQDIVCSTFALTAKSKLSDAPFDGSLDVTIYGLLR